MELEDHAGDVVAKARGSAGLSASSAAALAGLSIERYQAFEATGRGDVPNLAALAERLGLHAGRLDGIARGWRPGACDLGRWRELRRVVTERGMAVNCYLIWDEVTREAALFDTGWSADPVLELIVENGLQLRHLFITHGHTDHLAGLAEVRERFPKARLHSSSAAAPVDQRNRASDFIHLGSLRITNRPTPGHAEDGVTYVVGNWPEDAPNVAMVGDALFAGSMGRAGAALELARQKVREQVFSLPPETLICPGHGPLTTVAEEKAHNPFFGG
jgi:glyoxylase-like metal-dependent hydrolase (beta-lactamase superfamily II)